MARTPLNEQVTVTADAAGGATASIGPDSGRGPARWNVTKLGVVNALASRRGQPPIPVCNVYIESESLANLLEGTYDGSFDFTDVDLDLTRGQTLIAVWAGGQAGDRMTLSVTGFKGD